MWSRARQHKVLSALASIALLSSMGMGPGGSAPSARAASPVTVSVWSWRPQDKPLWQEVQKQLQAQGLNIKIAYTTKTATQYDAILQTAMTGGQGPDVFYGRAGVGIAKYAATHLIAPLNGKVDFSTLAPSTLGAMSYQGKYYGVPSALETVGIFYNKSIFAKYNLSVPTTWQQLLSLCATLQSKGVNPVYVEGVQQWLIAIGIEALGAGTVSSAWSQSLADGKVGFNSAPYIRTLAKMQELRPYFEHNYTAAGSNGSDEEQALALGRTAMIMEGIWGLPGIMSFNKNAQIGFFMAPPDKPSPQPKAWYAQAPAVDWYLDAGIALNAKISNPAEAAAALKVVQFTATPAFGRMYSNTSGELSPIKGVKLAAKYPLSRASYQWFQNPSTVLMPNIGYHSAFDNPPPTSTSDVGIFTAEMNIANDLITGKLTAAQAANKVQAQLSWYFKAKHKP